MILEHMQCGLNKFTFRPLKIRRWVEAACEGEVLNLFAGETPLNVRETRNDIRADMLAEYRKDALAFVEEWNRWKFQTVLLDPPYSYRKSMEMYQGAVSSPFKRLKDAIPRILAPGGIVITFGYHSVSMGKKRGFEVKRVLLISHGGAIHDTIATVERLETK